ncbi:RICIN domain-containing protein [Streptomyces gamaensis]|uniref:RICIN domain-containing protein n=1 Tax=Streptomyces gamaensis TaxID=1763542 RepID=A0ABW0Z482_9ACTN
MKLSRFAYPVATAAVLCAVSTAMAAPASAASTVTFKNAGSGKNLEIDNKELQKDGAKVQQWDYKRSPAPKQGKWILKGLGNGKYSIVNAANGKNLEIDNKDVNKDGAKVQQWGYKGSNVPKNGQWIVKALGKGAYSIVNAANGKNLEIDNKDVAKNGAKAQQWGYKKGSNVPKVGQWVKG